MKASSKRLIIVGLVLAALLGAILYLTLRDPSGERRSLDRISTSEEIPAGDSLHPIRIAVVLEPGLFEINDQGEISGKMPDLARTLLDGLSYTWVPVTDASLGLSLLDERRVELLATDQAAITVSRDSSHLYTAPLSSVSYALVSLEDSLFWGDVLSGPEEVSVAYSRENRDAATILENLHDISYTAIDPLEMDIPPLEIVMRVLKGEVRYAVIKRILAEELRERFLELSVATGVSFEAPQVWTIRRDATALRDTINARIQRTRNDQTL